MPKMILTLAIITRNSSKVVTPLSLLCFVGCYISGLLTVFIDFLYSNLKVVTKQVDIKHSKAAFEDIEKLHQ